MEKKFRDLKFADLREYESTGKNIPLEFYLKTFPVSKKIDIFLGYYSSYVFKTLSHAMASFIYNGGSMRIITNEFLSENDKKNLLENSNNIDPKYISNLIRNKKLNLDPESAHFYDCLKYLMNNNRLKIQPVKFIKNDDDGLEHKKQLILYDGQDYISTSGSINLTLSAIIKNDETFTLDLPWEYSEITQKRIEERRKTFESIINKENRDFKYINSNDIISDIKEFSNEKNLAELMSDSKKLKSSIKVSEQIKELIKLSKQDLDQKIRLSNKPKFPFDQPYPYQDLAYNSWVENNFSGLFEMATGTGKTLTSILCLINEYNKTNVQKNIIVVPGKELVRQWVDELQGCSFENIFSWYSENKNLHSEIKSIKAIGSSKTKSLNIVITYDSFKESKKFESIFKNDFKDFIVVFDEAHNMGSIGFMKSTKKKIFGKTIGLSATPLRDWDEQGSNDFIDNFFKSEKPVFKFSMEEAIGRFLCDYNYFPFFCHLEDDEWDLFKYWTKKIPIKPKDRTINANAAMQRQAVIDKAVNKRTTLIKILELLLKENNISNTLVYCPKGLSENDEEEEKIIHMIAQSVAKNFKNQINHQFFLGETKDRDLLLKEFENQEVDLLYAIKCLDEGVNVPSTKNAIFIASGKNKREFIQRRGRVLRKFKGKEIANIYDIIVLPTTYQFQSDKNYAEKLLIGEFGRLIEFMEISKNKLDSINLIDKQLQVLSQTYLGIKELIEENEQNYITKENS